MSGNEFLAIFEVVMKRCFLGIATKMMTIKAKINDEGFRFELRNTLNTRTLFWAHATFQESRI